MKSIYDLFLLGTRIKKGLGEFGIEIETETKEANYYPKDFFGESLAQETPGHGVKVFWHPRSIPEWTVTEDGSLRDFGREFVLKEPLNYDLAMMAIDSWGQATKDIRFTQNAPSTSVHVHMNITKFTPLQLVNLFTLLVFFENLLTEFCGETRRSNTFARPCRCVDAILDNIRRMIDGIENGSKKSIVFSPAQAKYAVLNLSTMSLYGSLEVRSMRGTTNPEEIKDWLSILNRLYKYAQLPGLTPSTFYDVYREIEFEIVDRIFGSDSDKLKHNNWRDMLRRNEFFLADIATLVQSWGEFGTKYSSRDDKDSLSSNELYQIAQQMMTNQPPALNWAPAPATLDGLQGSAVVVDDLPEYEPDDNYDPNF